MTLHRRSTHKLFGFQLALLMLCTNTKTKLTTVIMQIIIKLCADESGSDNSACGLARYKEKVFVVIWFLWCYGFCSENFLQKFQESDSRSCRELWRFSGKLIFAVGWRRFLGPWNFSFRQPQNHPRKVAIIVADDLSRIPPLVIRLEIFSKRTTRERGKHERV